MALQRVKLCVGSLAITAGCAAGLLMLSAGEASATVQGFGDCHDQDHNNNHNRGHNNRNHNRDFNHNHNENINIIVIELPPTMPRTAAQPPAPAP